MISLVGLMGSGKTEVGRTLARRLGWEFIDTDAEIEAREGRSVAAIFQDAGEGDFRRVERDVVRRATRGRRRVIATGGGAVLSPRSRRALTQAGPVFYLRAPVEVLLQRVGNDPSRPLLGDDPRASLERLLREREALYLQTGMPVDAARPADAVADDILAHLAASRRRVRVDLGPRSYDVLIGIGAQALVGYDLEQMGAGGQVAVVTHRSLLRRFGASVVAALEGCGFMVRTIAVPAGERAKTLRQASRILDALGAAGLTRSDTLVALGGGVIGDLAGFAAGIYMRGIRFVQLPTTLLAQLDSSIGGKTGVNHPRAKNLVGVYHQPALVVADIEVLRHLPLRERRAGLAEAVKYGVVLDRDLFEWLARDPQRLLGRDAWDDLEEIVFRCASLKARVVAQDEFEQGPREVLNYGHTVGHAIEAAMPGALVHGEAVAVGMRVEARVAVRLSLMADGDADRQDTLLRRLGLPVTVPEGPVGPLLDAMRLDKKRRDGRIRCTLPEGIGRARLGVDVPESLMEEVLRLCQESW
ncbi:MAG: 3-dehydroquinate synthase [Armatimonadota bacterium]|nr:3-dehydroquinate synthase [Armatimonadota bacterium]